MSKYLNPESASFGGGGRLWGTKELKLSRCSICNVYSDKIPADMFFTGRICPACGHKDTRYVAVIRPSASALLDIGFKLNGVKVMFYREMGNCGNAEWKIRFQFLGEYRKEVFSGLSRKFQRIKGCRQRVTSLCFRYTHPIVPVLVRDSESELLKAREAMFVEVSQHMFAFLMQWVRELEVNGNLAVWKLAGYFE